MFIINIIIILKMMMMTWSKKGGRSQNCKRTKAALLQTTKRRNQATVLMEKNLKTKFQISPLGSRMFVIITTIYVVFSQTPWFFTGNSEILKHKFGLEVVLCHKASFKWCNDFEVFQCWCIRCNMLRIQFCGFLLRILNWIFPRLSWSTLSNLLAINSDSN